MTQRGAWKPLDVLSLTEVPKCPQCISPIAQCLPFALPLSFAVLSTSSRESTQREGERESEKVCVELLNMAPVAACACMYVCETFRASFLTPTHDRQSSSCSRERERECAQERKRKQEHKFLSLSGIGQFAHRGARAICTGIWHMLSRQSEKFKEQFIIIAIINIFISIIDSFVND